MPPGSPDQCPPDPPAVTAETCFAIIPTGAGFTDQMLQFSVFYRLGLSLGYVYRHLPFHSPRTSAGPLASPLGRLSGRLGGFGDRLERWLAPDIYDFVGFNRHFGDAVPDAVGDVDAIDLSLSDELLAADDVVDFAGLQAFVKARVDKAAGNGARLVRFRLGGGRNFFATVHDAVRDYPDGLDLRGIYFASRARRPWRIRFPAGRLKTVVHIRQGDTAVVRTPWHTYIPLRLRSGSQNALIEYADFHDIPGNVLQVCDYEAFLAGLSGQFGAGAFSRLVFSDGFARAFDMIRRQRARLQLADDRQAELEHSEAGYDRREFAALAAMPNSRLVVGERTRQLCDLVHASLTADLVILGPQQRMIPKLLANYCTYDTMPLVIALERGSHEGELEDYHRMLGFHARRDRFIYVNVDRPDYGAIADRLTAAFPELGPFRVTGVS